MPVHAVALNTSCCLCTWAVFHMAEQPCCQQALKQAASITAVFPHSIQFKLFFKLIIILNKASSLICKENRQLMLISVLRM